MRDEMHNDDTPVGRILSRREVMTLAGSAGLAGLLGLNPLPAFAQGAKGGQRILVSPASTEGPFFVDEKLNRSDVRSDPGTGAIRPGVPLELVVNLAEVTGSSSRPIEGAQVDIWHCDALGKYSDEASEGTAGQKFLRGYQVSNGKGQVKFTTVYPGWYPGRAVHIHFKIRRGSHEFTSQWFFDDKTTDEVFVTSAPYSTRSSRTTRNSQDGIFREGGDKLLLALKQTAAGFRATFDVGLVF